MGKKRGNRKYLVISCISIIAFLIVWYLATAVFEIFPQSMLPSPVTVFISFFEKWVSTVPDGAVLGTHIISSLIVVMTGYIAGVIIGIPVGIIMAWFEKIDFIIRPIFDFLRTIPGIAWITVVTVWLGINLPAKATIIFINVFVGTVVNVYAGIKQTDIVHIWVAQIFGADRIEILKRVAIPSALPYVFTGLRVSMAMAWLGLVAAELIAANSGLGYMIQVARNFGRADLVIVGMITIGLLGTVMTLLLEMVEKKFVKGE